MHQGSLHTHHTVYLAIRDTGGHAQEVLQSHRLHLLLSQPVYRPALAGDCHGFYRDTSVQRNTADSGSHRFRIGQGEEENDVIVDETHSNHPIINYYYYSALF